MDAYPDLKAIAAVRDLCARSSEAQRRLAEMSQDAVDRIVAAMGHAARDAAAELGTLAHEETGFGDPGCKREKNLFSAVKVLEFILPMRTVGVLGWDAGRKVVEIAEPVGVVAAILPSTNPTSTAIYKALIAVKARNGIVMSPHPYARSCTRRTAEILAAAATRAGAPEGLLACIETPSADATGALMKDPHVGVILATGGSDLVRAAYSAGKPCFGVGPGNVPAYVHESADVPRAVARILQGKLFDNGTLCSSEQAVVVDRSVSDRVVRELASQGAHFLSAEEQERLSRELLTPRLTVNPKLLGRPAAHIAAACGIEVPGGTRVLVAPLAAVGRAAPLSAEKLSPVLAYYTVADWREGCRRCKEILAFGGAGHTLSLHARDRDVIFRFALEKPAFRIVANAPAATGAVGLHTGLDPAMTLGCGAMGGNITSDNISPRHLMNVKRLALGTEDDLPFQVPAWAANGVTAPAPATAPHASAGGSAPAAAPRDLAREVERFLVGLPLRGSSGRPVSTESAAPVPTSASPAPDAAVDFVCEDDVRRAITEGRVITLHARTIVTPAARDLGAIRGVFRRLNA